MKVGGLRRLNAEDFPGLPETVVQILEPINEINASVVSALQGNLTFAENFQAESRTFKVKHNVTQEVELKTLKAKPRFVLASPTLYDPFKFAWQVARPGIVQVKLIFDSAPSAEQEVTFLFLSS